MNTRSIKTIDQSDVKNSDILGRPTEVMGMMDGLTHVDRRKTLLSGCEFASINGRGYNKQYQKRKAKTKTRGERI